MLRIILIFAAVTGLLWLADWIDTPDSVPAIKPLFWGSVVLLAALLVRALADFARRGRNGGPRRGAGGDAA